MHQVPTDAPSTDDALERLYRAHADAYARAQTEENIESEVDRRMERLFRRSYLLGNVLMAFLVLPVSGLAGMGVFLVAPVPYTWLTGFTCGIAGGAVVQLASTLVSEMTARKLRRRGGELRC